MLMEAAGALERKCVQVKQADERGDEAMRRAHAAEELADSEGTRAVEYLRRARRSEAEELRAAQEADELRVVLLAVKAWDCEPAQMLTLTLPLDRRQRMQAALGA